MNRKQNYIQFTVIPKDRIYMFLHLLFVNKIYYLDTYHIIIAYCDPMFYGV